MNNFSDLYQTFEDFYNSFFRGNEVEFLYNGNRFCIFPKYNSSKRVIGVFVGKAYDEQEIFCASKEELYKASLGDSSLGEAIEKIKIVWNNI